MSLRDEIEKLRKPVMNNAFHGNLKAEGYMEALDDFEKVLDKYKVPDCKKCKRIKLSKRRDLKFLILAFKAGAQEAEATIRFDFPEDITIAERVWGALQDCWQPPLPNQSLCARTKALKKEE